ncbi:unnamed protein product [Rotaria sp. Silwood1]|nr:unnamed protein product [Rotaria sp. Silwood1]CAF1460104.1 unnamed protein product [Rotaria sp. Silwood1]CAF1479033.1 unnamed protein product [Rotaria sp. Silwood1]
MRIAILGASASASGAVDGILTYGISYMQGIGGLKSWQWTFLLEGSPIIPLGVLVYLLLDKVPNAVQWLNNIEKQLLTNLLRDDAGVADSESIPGTRLSWRQVRYVFIDWQIYLYSIIAGGNFAAIKYLITFLPTLTKAVGYTKTEAHLMTALPYAVACVCALLIYREVDKPMYQRGHLICGGLIAVSMVATIILRIYLMKENNRRTNLSSEEYTREATIKEPCDRVGSYLISYFTTCVF